MADQFLGEIRMFSGNFAPYQWALCDGQILAIQQYSALFALLGVTFGGNGTSNFGLPNMQGMGPMAPGPGGGGLSMRDAGEFGGASTVTVTASEMTLHTHLASGATDIASGASPVASVWTEDKQGRQVFPYYYDSTYASSGKLVQMNTLALAPAPVGGGQAHNNVSPYLAVTFIIALSGAFPTRS